MEAQCQDKLKNDSIRNYADYPSIFGLSEDEVLSIMEAVQNYSHTEDGEDSQSYKDWCKMYSGIHKEWEHDVKLRSWLACIRWMKEHNEEKTLQAIAETVPSYRNRNRNNEVPLFIEDAIINYKRGHIDLDNVIKAVKKIKTLK